MKKWLSLLLVFCLSVGCQMPVTSNKGHILTDSLGHQATIPDNARVVALYGSYAQCWALAGGELVGVTEDAVTERGMVLNENMQLVGSVKEPSLEVIVSLNPDYIIMSADLTQHLQLEESLRQMGISYGYFRMDTFEDYAQIMSDFCRANGEEGRISYLVEEVRNNIQQSLSRVPEGDKPDVLLIRAYSTGMKAKRDDNLAGVILKELGCHNIADDDDSMLEDLSMEEIIQQDPDYIFVLTMGNEEKAKEYLTQAAEQNPAWSGLKAVKAGNYIFLPKELFHYKPNERWDESYEYIANILYPERIGN